MLAMRRTALFAALATVSPAGGCCTLARLFCGPDRTPWVSVDFATPERTVRTLLEALRRDDPEIVYLSLSSDFRDRLGVDSQSAKLAWPKIREQNPGLHLAGYAEVPPAVRRAPDRADVRLDVEGQAIEIELVREAYWLVRYERPGDEPGTYGPPGECGGKLDSFVGSARVEPIDDPDTDRSRLVLAPFRFEHFGHDAIPLENIDAAGLERRWKIAALRLLER